MANVFFKRGLHANLPSQAADVVDGAFYLTTDTNRLYVGNGSTLVELNKSITSVTNISDLPRSGVEVGQFYYVSGPNILCYYDGSNNDDHGWVQINPDTVIADAAQNTRVTLQSYDNDITGATVTSTVTDTKSHSSIGSYTIKGDANLDVSVSGTTITLSPNIGHITSATNTTYTIGTTTHQTNNENDGANINLTSSDTTPIVDTVSIIGTNSATVTQANDVITIDVADPEATTQASFSNQGVLTINTSVNDVSSTPGTVTPVITLGTNTDQHKFISGTANLPVYTKTEVDDLIEDQLAAANAMTYKGVVGQGDTQEAINADAAAKLVTSGDNALVGNTWKAANDITSPVSAKTGDLIIAQGTDGAVTYEVIPSGDDQTITGSARQLGITVSDQSGDLAKLDIASGTHITATGVTQGAHGTTITIAQATDYTAQTIAGSAANVTQDAGTSTASTASFTAVTAISTDAYGNVVNGSIQTKTFTVTDTHNYIETFTSAVTAPTLNSANVALTMVDHDGNQAKTANVGIVSNSLDLTKSGDNLSVELVWGSF